MNSSIYMLSQICLEGPLYNVQDMDIDSMSLLHYFKVSVEGLDYAIEIMIKTNLDSAEIVLK